MAGNHCCLFDKVFVLRRAILLYLTFLLLLGCVSLKIEIPQEPDGIVEYVSQVKKIAPEPDFSREIKSETILRSDERIYVIIKVLNLETRSTLRWYWFDPANRLVKTSEEMVVNQEKKFLEYFVAWDSLGNSHFKSKDGTWTVVVRLDGNYLTEKTFAIKK